MPKVTKSWNSKAKHNKHFERDFENFKTLGDALSELLAERRLFRKVCTSHRGIGQPTRSFPGTTGRTATQFEERHQIQATSGVQSQSPPNLGGANLSHWPITAWCNLSHWTPRSGGHAIQQQAA